MKYKEYSYIYPPRPKNAIPINTIDKWDNNIMVGQPKMNGSNASIYTDGSSIYVMNRHGQRLTNFNLNKSEILNLHRGTGWIVLNGEYLNKSKNDETGKSFNHKFIIFDILVYNSEYLVGSTFQERINILDSLYGTKNSEKEYLLSISENIYRVKSFYNGFSEIFNNLTKIDVIEGLVCKRKNARLELGTTENNNSKSQIKFRKQTRNYKF